MFANKNVGDPNKRTYEADTSRPARSAGSWTVASVRLTGQLTPRNRLGIFWDEQRPCHGGSFAPGIEACRQPKNDYVLGGSVGSSSPVASAINAPEVASYSGGNYLRVQQATWSSTVSGRLLLEAGFGTYLNHWGGVEIPGNPTRDIVRVVEQCSAGCAANGGIAGLTYRSQNWAINIQKAFNWKASATYVTGRHSLKVGYQASFNYTSGHPWTNSQNLQFRVNNGIPNQLTQNMAGFYTTENRVPTFGVYAQEQWTAGRVTFQGAVRYDHASSFFPEQKLDANRFLRRRRPASPDGRRHGLRRHHASRRRGVGSVRRRQDGGQDQRGPVPAERRRLRAVYGHQSAHGHPAQRHPHVDGRQQQFLARLQPDEPEQSGSSQQRRRLLRRGQRSQLRHVEPECAVRPGPARRLGPASRGLAVRAPPSSRRCCRGFPWRPAIPAAGS